MIKGNAVIGQSGGPTCAINATLAGVFLGLRDNENVKNIYGMKNGIEGFLKEDLVDLRTVLKDEDSVFALECTPSAALGSCRKKLPADMNDALYEEIFALFEKHDIRYFFYIGGNDSMDTAAKLSAYAEKCGREMHIMGVPKTIDNDLAQTDHTPGFGSAAKFVATTMQEIARDCAVYKVKAVTIVEIMGRDAGWLTAAAGLPRLNGSLTADLIYLPEVDFDNEAFLAAVRAELEKKPNVTVAVSEGIHYADGHYVGEGAQSGATDIFGHKYLAGTAKQLEMLVKAEIGCKVRSVELSLPQRCAAHIASKTDIEESVRIGKAAAEAALGGMTAAIPMFVRKSTEPYIVDIECKKVSEVANEIRKVPRDGINEEGNNVTDALLKEIMPLIGGQLDILYKNGLPVHLVID